MENKELLEMVRSKAQSWLTKSYDAETRAQVQALLNNEDPTELIESFYKDLEFGTGGLRGIMGVGSKPYEHLHGRSSHTRLIQLSEKGICRSGPHQSCHQP